MSIFNSLFYATKRRILDEVIDTFNKHPSYSGVAKVYNKYPYKERVQYGVVLRNTGASSIRLSPDNFMGDLVTHVRMARVKNKPGVSVEWAREDAAHLTRREIDEDVSSQLGATQRRFFTAHKPIMAGPANTELADNFRQIRVTINGSEVFPEFVEGATGTVVLPLAPGAGSTVLVTYYYKTLSPAGRYLVDMTSDTEFSVLPLLDIDSECLIENTDGTETSSVLGNSDVNESTLSLYLQSENGGPKLGLAEGADYTFTVGTSTVTFLNPLSPGYNLFAKYRYFSTMTSHTIPSNYSDVNSAIPGISLAFARRAREGDQQIIIVTDKREDNARVYGGHWTMALSLGVIAKDSIQMEEMTDHLVSDLWFVKKNKLEFEGLTLNSVEPSGETEEIFSDLTGDMYYESSVEISIQTEWQRFVPYLFAYDGFNLNLNLTPEQKDYGVNKDGSLSLIEIVPDVRVVAKSPMVGYSKMI